MRGNRAAIGFPWYGDRVSDDTIDADLSPELRAWISADEVLRTRASILAAELQLDEHDVYRVLKQLARSPRERLCRGLAHGRLGRLARR